MLLEEHSAGGSPASSVLDFTSWYSADYDEYIIRVVGILPATDNANFQVLASTDGGASYDTSSIYDTQVQLSWSNSTSEGGSVNGAAGVLVGNVGNDSTGAIAATYTLSDPASTTRYKSIRGDHHFWHATLNTQLYGIIGCLYRNTSAVNALRFLFSSGNIASGTIRIYGVAKS